MTRARIAITFSAAIVLTAAAAVTSSAASTKFYASISGKQEVPSKGDSDGTAKVVLTVTGKKLCYDIRPTKLETPQAAHIHTGNKGKAGGILINLFTSAKAPTSGKITGCATITAAQLEKLVAKPSGFYVNLHTKKFPSGAARGQLTRMP